jgi:hypothetical protein
MMDSMLFFILASFCDVQPVTESPFLFDLHYIGMQLEAEKSENECTYTPTEMPEQAIAITIDGNRAVTPIGELIFHKSADTDPQKYTFKSGETFVKKIPTGISIFTDLTDSPVLESTF